MKTCLPQKPVQIYCSFIHNCPNWKPLRWASEGEWICKMVIQTKEYYPEINEMNCLAMKKHGGSLNTNYWVKEANVEKLYTAWFQLSLWKRQNYADSKKISDCQGWCWGRWVRRTWTTCEAVKILVDSLLKIHVTIHLTKPIECATPQVCPRVSYVLGVIITCQCEFINCKECTILFLYKVKSLI